MLNRLLFLAQIDLLDPTANKPTGPNFHFDDTLVIVVAALVVAVLLFLATYLSKGMFLKLAPRRLDCLLKKILPTFLGVT